MNEVKITLRGEEAMHFLERLVRIEEDLAECVEFIREQKKDQTSQSRKSSPKTVCAKFILLRNASKMRSSIVSGLTKSM